MQHVPPAPPQQLKSTNFVDFRAGMETDYLSFLWFFFSFFLFVNLKVDTHAHMLNLSYVSGPLFLTPIFSTMLR